MSALPYTEWNAEAEVAMMGCVIPVQSEEQLTHVVKYCLRVLRDTNEEELEERSKEIVNNAMHKYNSNKDHSIKYLSINDFGFGMMFTFVRDKTKLTLKSGAHTNTGSLAWVENIDMPDCSELGYVFFEQRNGTIKRIS